MKGEGVHVPAKPLDILRWATFWHFSVYILGKNLATYFYYAYVYYAYFYYAYFYYAYFYYVHMSWLHFGILVCIY